MARAIVHRGAVVAAIAVAASAYFVSAGLESLIIQVSRAAEGELLWLSDVLLSLGLGLATYLWLDLRATRETLSTLEREQLRLATQLSIAADIQRRLLPPVPELASGLRWAAAFEPAGRIGGDLYDFVQRHPGRLLALVADISGKGIPAAILMAITRSTFRTIASQVGDPASLLELLSTKTYEDNQGSAYVTGLLCEFDLDQRTLTYVNAGHPPAVMLHASGTTLLDVGGPPLGLLAAVSYESRTVRFEPGDVGVLVTDGITEGLADDRTPAHEAIEAALARLARPFDPGAVCDAVMALAKARGGPAGVENWTDDRTVVTFVVE